MATFQRDLQQLRATGSELAKEREQLGAELASWDSKLAQKRAALQLLEQTLLEIQKGTAEADLPRTEAEAMVQLQQQSLPKPQVVPAPAAPRLRPEEQELSRKVGAAMLKLSTPSGPLGFDAADYAREFYDDRRVAENIPAGLTDEQRFCWELQNPPLYSLRVESQLLQELKVAGRNTELELLQAAAGPPSLAEKQYRALLWLEHHPKLDVKYKEPSSGASLVSLASDRGYDEVVRELLKRQGKEEQDGDN